MMSYSSTIASQLLMRNAAAENQAAPATMSTDFPTPAPIPAGNSSSTPQSFTRNSPFSAHNNPPTPHDSPKQASRPADINTSLILWIIAACANAAYTLIIILNGSLQKMLDSMNTTAPQASTTAVDDPSHQQIHIDGTFVSYTYLIIMTAVTLFIIWKYSLGSKLAFFLLAIGGIFTIFSAIGVYSSPATFSMALTQIIAGVASVGALISGRTPEALAYIGIKINKNNG